jgi:PAS domain S-box-containing protein
MPEHFPRSRDDWVRLAETLREPVVILEGTLRVWLANRAFYRTFHLAVAETEGRSVYELGSGEWNNPGLHMLLDELVPRSSRVEDFDLEQEIPLLGVRTIRVNATRSGRKEDGADEQILLAFDVRGDTDQDALRESEDRWRRVLDALPAAAYTCDSAGLITYFNQQAVQLWVRAPKLNHPDDRFCGSFRLYGPDGTPVPHDACFMAFAVKEGQPINGAEAIIERPDGERRFVLAHANPLRDSSGQLSGAINVLVDITERRRLEDALRESEDRLRLALAATRTGVWEWDVRTGAMFWSPECFEILGRETFTGTLDTFTSALHPEDRPPFLATLEQAQTNPDLYVAEFRIIRPDGAVRWLVNVGRASCDEEGKPLRLVGIVRDITERRNVEEALRESQHRFRQLTESLPQLIFTCRADGSCDYISPQTVRYTGLPEAALLGHGWLEQIHPHDRERTRGTADAKVVTDRDFHIEQRIRRHDGVYRWFITRAVPLRDAEGKVVKWLGTSTDIDDQMRIEAALRASDERLRAILDSTMDAIVTMDERGLIESVNPATEKMFGCSAGELVGQNVKMLMPPPHRDEHDDYLARHVHTGEKRIIGISREVQARRKDGLSFPVDLAVSEFHVQGQRRFIGTIRDISARKQLEREVLEVATLEQRRIGQALYDSTGQELTALGLLAETLADSLAEQAPVAAPLAVKVREGIKRVLAQVRGYTRGLIPVDVDSRGLRAALSELATRTSEIGVSCLFHHEGQVDVEDNQTATHLYHIAQEAVTNALCHAQARQIVIRLEGDDNLLTLSVRDDGVGLPPEPVETRGMGLKIMRYRAGLIQAWLNVEAAQPSGTLVTCTLSKGATNDQEQVRPDSDRR